MIEKNMLNYKIKQNKKINFNMIDFDSLPKNEIEFVRGLIEILKNRQERKRKEKKRKTNFGVWNLGVKGKLTREEIYDYL
ncbi:hypothetical protein A2Y83_01465 [Candidatus Falkowbacteria bacterium RBG_13_39_14]|uniref:Uncharacterized protein n=1 Tax=Candidatus Falkowbacteria bacterium RBG_13_39_14 TaxID=1797985 RepID=A0A1F5S1F8_9BACT|nr:MAG: hypothetical protein A2Y83_01465 [Candidatus Falkowbacteria bacterium RBG_13_39_14]